LETLLSLYGACVQYSLSSGKRVRFEQFGADSLHVEAAALALSHMLLSQGRFG
jgi:hypothetical protein